MKKRINGKIYNTETAKFLVSRGNGRNYSDFGYYNESLYKKKTGEFFIYCEGGPMTTCAKQLEDGSLGYGEKIIPLTNDEVKAWLKKNADVETANEILGSSTN